MYNPDIHRRTSCRLKGYDYSQAGAYFVTICTKDSERLFGEITDGRMRTNLSGEMVRKWWMELINKFKNIELGEHVITPNHLHGIIIISNGCRGEVSILSATNQN